MYQDGIGFFKSENGVWLTENIEPKYLMTAHHLIED